MPGGENFWKVCKNDADNEPYPYAQLQNDEADDHSGNRELKPQFQLRPDAHCVCIRPDMPVVNLKQAALAWAEAGFYCFPCRPNDKAPLIDGGHKLATTDPKQIASWWDEHPAANIGCVAGRSGMYVLDVDPPLGAAALARLEVTNGALPPTLTIRTPRGGLHYWFEGDVPSTVSKLAEKIDTRGRDTGYVLVPPSIVKGNPYVVERNCAIEVGPAWIHAALATNSVGVSGGDVSLDQPGNIARARALLSGYVSAGHVAVEGMGGDNRTYQVACEVLNLGLSPGKALEVIEEIWNPHCSPPWDREDLIVKLTNAIEYAQNDAGAWAVPAPEQLFAGLAKYADPVKRSRFWPIFEEEFEHEFQEPQWLIPDLIPANGLVQLTGRQKSFKTFLALDLALGLASGLETFGHAADERRSVVYIAGENASMMAREHIKSWRIAKSFYEPIQFAIVPNMPLALLPEQLTEFTAALFSRKLKPDLVVIDTATRALRGLDENSAKDMGLLSHMCETIQREFLCTVVLIRHTGKDPARGSRGSNVIEGDFDTVLEVARHEKTSYASLRVIEQRNAAEADKAWYFHANQIGNSLVMSPVGQADYTKGTTVEDQFSRQKVGAALRKLGAFGAEHAANIHVLAVTLIEGHATPEQLAAAERSLRKLAKDRLEAYHEAGAWFLPAEHKQDEQET